MSKKLKSPTEQGLIPPETMSDFLDLGHYAQTQRKWKVVLEFVRKAGYKVRSRRDFLELMNRSAAANMKPL